METDTEVITAESGTLALLNKSEIDMQIATAHKYPRSVVNFRRRVFEMVTLSEQIAAECIYAVPRDGKMIEGPSARFAEVVASAWGNSRAGARVVSDQGEFVTAQGVFHDLEQNVAITYEVQRRITNKQGRRFSADMIAVTANAACSIALRNAILKGVPKAFWSEMYDGARKTAMGDVKTLPTRRAEALDALLRYGISPEQVYAKLEVAGKEDLGLEQLATLRFILTALKEGDTTPEQAFAPETGDSGGAKPPVSMPKAKPSPAPAAPPTGAPVDKETGEIGAKSTSHSTLTPEGDLVHYNTGPSGNSALATEGERKLILNRCRSNNIEVAALMLEARIEGLPADLAGLTKDGFIALKDLLPKAA
jgi:hypothetical protein